MTPHVPSKKVFPSGFDPNNSWWDGVAVVCCSVCGIRVHIKYIDGQNMEDVWGHLEGEFSAVADVRPNCDIELARGILGE